MPTTLIGSMAPDILQAFMTEKTQNAPQSGKVGFISLGCPKALVDSERILTQLRLDGYDVVPSYDDADIVVVNTCGFIDAAKQESLDAIGEAISENGKVIVTGCMGKGNDAEVIRSAFPEVLGVSGPAAYDEVVSSVHEWAPPVGKHDPFVDLVPPQGIKYDTPEQIRALTAKIAKAAVTSETMPLANATNMTTEERELLGTWIAQGATIPPAIPNDGQRHNLGSQ